MKRAIFFLLLALPHFVSAQSQRDLILVNGGVSEAENYETHEMSLQSAEEILSHKNEVILDADGAQSATVVQINGKNGLIPFDSIGNVKKSVPAVSKDWLS